MPCTRPYAPGKVHWARPVMGEAVKVTVMFESFQLGRPGVVRRSRDTKPRPHFDLILLT